MRRSTLKTCAAALALAALSPVADADALQVANGRTASLPVRMQELEGDLLRAINVLRVQHRLRPLRLAPGLRRAAAAHSLEMARLGYFDHTSANGRGFWRRIGRFYPLRGYRRWEVGENLASSSPTMSAGETVSDWLQSPGHRANLLDRQWREAGVAAVYAESAPGEFEGEPTVIVTADFGYRRR
jgi:uncharacterized protein YkwD